MQKYGVSNSSWIRMTFAPWRAASRTHPLGDGEIGSAVARAGELCSGNCDFHWLQNVGGVQALMISQASSPKLRNRCGTALVK